MTVHRCQIPLGSLEAGSSLGQSKCLAYTPFEGVSEEKGMKEREEREKETGR